MSDTVLVTGATGFIGRALAARLRADGHKVIAIGSAQGDIAEAATLKPLAGRGIRHVFHLAGRTFVPDSWSDPQGFIRTNIQGTQNVLEFCRQAGASLTFMSAYLYGVPEKLPIAEDAPVRPNNPYAQSKQLAEEACRSYAANHSLAVTVLRPFNVYGPGQADRFLVPTILRQALKEPKIEVLDTKPRRDWLFLSDLIEGIVTTGRVRSGYNVYNLGSGVSHSVSELIQVVQEVANTNLPVRSRATARTNEIGDTVADIRRVRADFGWTPRIGLREGIALCLTAINDNR